MQPYADRKPYDTIYSADYMNPGKESLTSNRRSIARTRSTLMNPVNDTKQALCLRGSYVLTQPEINPHASTTPTAFHGAQSVHER